MLFRDCDNSNMWIDIVNQRRFGMDREDCGEIKEAITKILKEYKVMSMEEFYDIDEEDGNVLYENLKAGVVEVYDLDDDEMGEILEEVLESM